MRPIIEVSNLSKCYRLGTIGATSLREEASRFWARLKGRKIEKNDKEFWALQDVSFSVQRGDIVGVVGRNGAGKSTLLKILSRITQPTSGSVALRGRVASLLEVGTGFHPDLTGRENIYLNGAILGMTRAEVRRKFEEIAAFAEISEFLDTPVKRYSSGMYVRLAFAVAAHLEPEILIVDEVLAVGDAEFQKKCLGKMKDVTSGDGRTVLFVSHNMDSVLRLCNRGLFLRNGALEYFGDVKQAVDLYSKVAIRQAAIISLPSGRHNGYLRREVQIARLCWHQAVDPWVVEFGSPIDFSVEFRIQSNVASLDLGIGLFSPSGFEIASCLSSHSCVAENLSIGSYTMSVSFVNPRLVPGIYILNFGFTSNFGFEDYVADACQLEVISSQTSAVLRTDSFRGVIVPETQMTLKKVNS